jgi:hypothetical protein
MDPAFKPDEPSPDLRVTPRVVLGLAVMLAGLVLALDSLGLVEGGAIFRFWPLAVVAVGIVKWLSPAPQRMSALIWIVAGVALLLMTLGHMSFAGVWAILLFLVGAKIAWKALRPSICSSSWAARKRWSPPPTSRAARPPR